MPEGDTIHRTAATLSRAIARGSITRFEVPGLRARQVPQAPRPGELVERVAARGKHLLIRCSGGLTLHTHLRMSGSWHLYRPDERWRRTRTMVVAIGTPTIDAICFAAPIVELLDDRGLERHRVLRALGPDLGDAGADLDEVERRAERYDPHAEVGVLLLDQTVASGVGNVYRAEVAWACRVDPFRPIHTLDRATRRELFATAHRLLRANLGTSRRTTVPGGLAVYDRAGRPCPRCGHAIETRRQGEQARSTWWCPGCQR